MEPEVISIAETRVMTRLGTTKIYELMNSGVLRSAKIGTRRLVRVDSIRALLAASQVAA